MAVSGSTDLTVDRNAILDAAGKLLGIVAEGGTCTSAQYTDLALWLNLLIKQWGVYPEKLWLFEEIILFPIKNRQIYNLGGSSVDRACTTDEFIGTELTAAAVNGATTITVDSITGISASDKIGIQTDEDGIHWTTVSGAPSGSTITLTAALVGDSANGSQVYTYTNAFTHKTLRTRHAVRRDMDNDLDIPMYPMSHKEYNSLTNKTQTGTILNYYCDAQRDETQMYVWPIAGNSEMDEVIRMSVQRPVYDFDASTDNPDFPQEWLLALAYNTAYVAAPVYGLSDQRFSRVASGAERFKNELLDWSVEDGSLFLSPESSSNMDAG